MKRSIKNIFIIIGLTFSFINNGYSQGIFESESPWETINQEEETMERGEMKSALKQNNNKNIRGGVTPTAGQSGVQDVPIDNGLLVVVIFFLGYGIYQIKQLQPSASKLGLRDNYIISKLCF